MPIQSTLQDGIIYTELSGDIDYDAVVAHTDFIFSLKGQIASQYELHDHTHTQSINLSADDIRQIAVYSLKLTTVFQTSFLAVYAPNDFTFGLARMFLSFFGLAQHPLHARIFRDKKDAIQSIKEKMVQYE